MLNQAQRENVIARLVRATIERRVAEVECEVAAGSNRRLVRAMGGQDKPGHDDQGESSAPPVDPYVGFNACMTLPA